MAKVGNRNIVSSSKKEDDDIMTGLNERKLGILLHRTKKAIIALEAIGITVSPELHSEIKKSILKDI